MSFADSASTLMYNTQSLAATSNVQLRSIIAILEQMLDNSVYQVTASDFNADIPAYDASDIPDVIAEVKGYLDGVLLDSAAIEGAVTNNATKAIAKVESMLADLVPADQSLAQPDRSIDTAGGVITSTRAVMETHRKRAETQLLGKFASMNFPAPPGACLEAIADLRLDLADKMADAALKAIQADKEQNITLFVQRAQREFDVTSQVVQAWSQLIDITVRMIGQLIADYEQSPMLNADVQAETASALVGAYAGLNRATTDLVQAVGTSYKAELAPYKLDVLEDQLKVSAYKASVNLSLSAKAKIASALSSALNNAGKVAGSCIGSISAHGSYVERSFS